MPELRKRYPLCWPLGWKRTTARVDASFGKVTTEGSTYAKKRALSAWDGAQRIMQELSALGVTEADALISTNLRTRLDGFPRSDEPEPRDPGAALYWQDKTGNQHCMAIDNYRRCADNLAAIAATLNALRAVKRHGGGAILDRTIEGLRPALPESVGLSWRKVLEFSDIDYPITADAVERRFREMARKFHPDQGGNHDHMAALNRARGEALAELAKPEEVER